MNVMTKRMLPLLLAIAMTSAVPAFAGRTADNTIYIEYGGVAGLYSLNFDRILMRAGGVHGVGARLGASWFPLTDAGDVSFFAIPVNLVYLYGRKEHKLEVNMGVVSRIATGMGRREVLTVIAPSAGYRFQMRESDFNLRIMFTPLLSSRFQPWGGISLGRSF